jgi:energy-coupling factor transporter ATP-binding protein EcfA2
LFADEPAGALDSRTSAEILALLEELVDVHAQAVVMVTNTMRRAASCASRVVFLKDGQIAAELAEPTPETVAVRMARLGSGPDSQGDARGCALEPAERLGLQPHCYLVLADFVCSVQPGAANGVTFDGGNHVIEGAAGRPVNSAALSGGAVTTVHAPPAGSPRQVTYKPGTSAVTRLAETSSGV